MTAIELFEVDEGDEWSGTDNYFRTQRPNYSSEQFPCIDNDGYPVPIRVCRSAVIAVARENGGLIPRGNALIIAVARLGISTASGAPEAPQPSLDI